MQADRLPFSILQTMKKTLPEISSLRLYHQCIARTKCSTPREVISHLGAIQAQDYYGALWSVGLRASGITDVAVEQSIVNKDIIRTWPMRGTLHFVTAADIRWMLELLTPRIIAGTAARSRQLELDADTFSRSIKVFERVLQDNTCLTRDEMLAALERAGIATAGQRGYHILRRLSQEGLICFGPNRAKQLTFVLLEEWVPPVRRKEREEALASLAERYFSSRGPATIQDFAYWSGLTAADAREGIAANKSRFAQESYDGKSFWMPSHMPRLTEPASRAFLLPGFDEYLLGYRDRGAVLEARYAQRICPGGNGMFHPTIVIDGCVAGTWRRTITARGVTVALHPFIPLSKKDSNAVAEAARQYGMFLNMPVTIKVGSMQ